MVNSTLEQKATKTMLTECHDCGGKLEVPKNFYSLENNREYDGFYKSPLGNPFCNKKCFDFFTED